MSIVNAPTKALETNPPRHEDRPAAHSPAIDTPPICSILDQVRSQIAPVWPLKDYVAVNPYLGLSDRKFLNARKALRSVSDLELLMPLDYYRHRFQQREFLESDINAAVSELVADGLPGAESICVDTILASLSQPSDAGPTADSEFLAAENPQRAFLSVTERIDQQLGSDWSRLVREEITRHCAAHYDQGQAFWSSAWKDLSLFAAWQQAAQRDRSLEILGVSGFRKRVSQLPVEPHEALAELMETLAVPADQWSDVLLCESLAMPGWSAWTCYQHLQADRADQQNTDFAGLLAMRLAYAVAIAEHSDLNLDWPSEQPARDVDSEAVSASTVSELHRYALLKATEIAYRRQLMTGLPHAQSTPGGVLASDEQAATERKLAQMVFCIDVRSERIRRHLENVSGEIETFGFAGFFGLPIEFVPLGDPTGSSQVPALISPQFKVHEAIDGADSQRSKRASGWRGTIRFLRKAWKDFQSSAISTFAFVETTGLVYGPQLVARSLGLGKIWPSRFDGVERFERLRLKPTLRGLNQQGISTSQQTDLAESMLRGIGIVENFGRLVVFCGHGSQTENNPLQAGLDCGACGGHSGESNARLAATLLNQSYIRQALVDRGIEIPEDTLFVGALHNTTTDELEFFDTDQLAGSQQSALNQLAACARVATQATRGERLSVLPGPGTRDLDRRSRDWSEVRPEWGLAGNAAFIVAPRRMTESISLEGRAFLHSYDYHNDPQFAVLEQIMTAPLVVANWINLQYYASTVDPVHFGSGNKTVHNVVGRFGILSGNGGDLMTGLPWQSVHDGQQYQHHPLRLLAMIAAPRKAIDSILARHENVASLLANGWLQLIAIENNSYFRYTEQRNWESVATPSETSVAVH